MRLLVLANALNRSFEAVLLRLLQMPGISGRVCSPKPPEHLIAAGIDWQPLKITSKLDVRRVFRIRKMLKTERYDIVQAFDNRALSAALAASRGLPSTTRIVGYRGIDHPVLRRDVGNYLTFFHPRLAGVWCISQAIRNSLARSGITVPTAAIPHGQQPEWYERPGPQALAELSIPSDAFVIATLSNIRKVKGIDVLLNAVRGLSDNDNLRVLLVGKRHDRRVERIAATRELRDKVIFTDYRADGVELISGADLYVQPSRTEGLSKSLMQAMLQGVCPIITRVGGMPELVRDGLEGIVIEKDDVSGLRDAITFLRNQPDLREKYARAAQQRIVEHFNVDRMLEKVYQFYARVISARENQRRVA